MRDWYQRKTPEERRDWVERRNPEKVKVADRARYYRDPEKRLAAAREYAKQHPEQIVEYKKRWQILNPEKRAAHIIVGNAIRNGRLIKGECERASEGQCKGKIQAHHDDYTKPLLVRWLCIKHHAELGRIPF